MPDYLFEQPKKRKYSVNTKIITRHFGFVIIFFIAFTVLISQNNHFTSAQTAEELESQINSKRSEIEKIDAKIKQYKSQIEAKRKEASTLKNQLSILDNQKEATILEINKLEIRTNQTELEIKANEKEIESLNKQQLLMKDQIAELIRQINKSDNKSNLEVILLYDNISEFFNYINYLENIEKGLQADLDHLQRVTDKLNTEQTNLLTRKNNLVAIKRKLEEQKARLESQEYTKNALLQKTKNSEKQYQSLIAKEKALQNSINSEIVTLEKSLREKLAGSKQLGDVSKSGLIWPVPSRYITAGFHDKDYPFRNIFEHPAIDIRAPQGTPVRAAASGYVARAKNGGMGYTYVMLVHANGISTVYGHLSQINVKEDTYVVQGEVIGLSGGMPGTPGAGNFTTGPHNHFEVRLNGVPVNPVPYLP